MKTIIYLSKSTNYGYQTGNQRKQNQSTNQEKINIRKERRIDYETNKITNEAIRVYTRSN